MSSVDFSTVREYEPLRSTNQVMRKVVLAVSAGVDTVEMSADDLKEIYAYVIGCNMEISDYRTIRYGSRIGARVSGKV